MMRQPPMYVPRAIATAQTTMTQNSGPLPTGWSPTEMSVRVMMPMVFWASLVPCASATSELEKICACRNPSRPSGLPS